MWCDNNRFTCRDQQRPHKTAEKRAERVKSSNEPVSVKLKVAAFYFSFKCNSACRNQPFKARILQLSQRFYSFSHRSSPHSASLDCHRTKAGKWITNDLSLVLSGSHYAFSFCSSDPRIGLKVDFRSPDQ